MGGDAKPGAVTLTGVDLRPKKPPAPSVAAACPQCRGTGWVCENHRDKPWRWASYHADACACGTGAPCECCNTSDPPEARWDIPQGAII